MRTRNRTGLIVIAVAVTIFLIAMTAKAQWHWFKLPDKDVTITVTVHTHNERTRELADNLQPTDFVVYEEKHAQPVISVRRAQETPVILAILVQDNLVTHVGNEIKLLKEFVRSLPPGSRVMIGYITSGALNVVQEFTDDRNEAANSLRIPIGSMMATPYFLYTEVVDAVRNFDYQPQGRRMVLMISDGLDISRGFRGGEPLFSVDLDRAIREAQRRGISIYSFYAPSQGLTSRSRLASNYGQGALNRLSEETGGESFFSGFDFVTFDPYFRELSELMDRQWVITYRSTNTDNGYRRIEVKTDFDLHLHYPAGYQAIGKK